jgi:hypothetical protein
VLRGYQILAELTAIVLSNPDASPQGRGIVIAPDRSGPLDRTVLGTVLSGLSSNPYLHATTLDDWFRTVPRAAAPAPGTPARALTPTPAPDLTEYATGLGLTRLSLASLASMLRPDNPLPDDLERFLRVASSSDLDPAQRQAYLDVVNGRLNDLRDPIDDIPKRKITLAGRSSEIPLTLHRRLPYPVTVIVRLSSSKLRFPKGDLVVRLDDETVQQRVPVEARANGTFPLEIEILTPAGDALPEAQATLTVQATALSGFGAVITGGGLLVLVMWWARHLRRRRRARGARRHPSNGIAPAPASSLSVAAPGPDSPPVPGFASPGDRPGEVNGH